MDTKTKQLLQQVISISSQIVLTAGEATDDEILAKEHELLALVKAITPLVGPIRAYSRYVNASSNSPKA